jgi:copper chaperone
MKLVVDGMTCGHCVRTITGAIQRLAPDAEVAIDLETGEVAIEGRIALADAVKAVGEEGYPVVAILEAASTAVDSTPAACCGTCRSEAPQAVS